MKKKTQKLITYFAILSFFSVNVKKCNKYKYLRMFFAIKIYSTI